MGVLRYAAQSGDIKVHWSPENSESTEKATKEWERLAQAGFEFFHGDKRVKKFDAKLGEVTAVPGVRSKDDKAQGTRQGAMSGGPNAA